MNENCRDMKANGKMGCHKSSTYNNLSPYRPEEIVYYTYITLHHFVASHFGAPGVFV